MCFTRILHVNRNLPMRKKKKEKITTKSVTNSFFFLQMRDKYFICHFKRAAVLFGLKSTQCNNSTLVPRREKKVACCWSLPNSINKSLYNNSWLCVCVCEMFIRWQNKHSQRVLSSFCIAWQFSYDRHHFCVYCKCNIP